MKKRIIIAGTASGCGKTTITVGILCALKRRGINVTSFKCGCDYIDLMFHREAISIEGGNIDTYFYEDDIVKNIFDNQSGEFSIIEGVMGFYDGGEGSTATVSRVLNCPTILIVNAKGTYTSVLPVIKGFKEWQTDNNIVAVVLNNITFATFSKIKQQIEEQGVIALGCLPKLPAELSFESRHLGLVTPKEIIDVKDKISKICDIIEECIDIDKLIELATDTKIKYNIQQIARCGETIIAVAKDKAFCFLYRENIELLEKMGAKIIFFSPIEDSHLPKCDGLYIGGGYPELYLDELECNVTLKTEIKKAIENGLPTIAECGGFMFLHDEIENRKMVGIVPGHCYKTDELKRFGYRELAAKHDNILLKKDEKIKSHEFHYFESDNCGNDLVATSQSGDVYDCAYANESFYGGFPHLALYSNVKATKRFVEKCIKYHMKKT